MLLVWIPIALVSVWDLLTTGIGIAHVFEASTFMTWAFSFVAAISLTAYLYASKYMWTVSPVSLRIITITIWIICFLFDIYTTFVGHSAIALDSSFRSAFDTNFRELIMAIFNLTGYQVGIIVVTTVFVVFCTLALGIRIGGRQTESPS